MERIFIGFLLSGHERVQLTNAFASHSPILSGIQWEREENYHLMLRHIGDITIIQREALQNRLAQLRFPSIPPTTSKLRLAPYHGAFRALQYDFHNKELDELMNGIDQCIVESGITLRMSTEHKSRPHLKIARNRGDCDRKSAVKWLADNCSENLFSLRLNEFHLLRSSRAKSGFSYEICQTFPLIEHLPPEKAPVLESEIMDIVELHEIISPPEEIIGQKVAAVEYVGNQIDGIVCPMTETIFDKIQRSPAINTPIIDPLVSTESVRLERIFIGVKLPPSIATELTERYGPHKSSLPGVKWEKEENLHVTIRFIGDMTTDKRMELQNYLSEISERQRSFPAVLQHYSVFASRGDFRVLHCTLSNEDAYFTQLQQLVDESLSSCGVSISDNKAIRPHVTLARNRKASNKAARAWIASRGEFDNIEFQVSEFQLIQSVTGKEGSTYITLQSYPLV